MSCFFFSCIRRCVHRKRGDYTPANNDYVRYSPKPSPAKNQSSRVEEEEAELSIKLRRKEEKTGKDDEQHYENANSIGKCIL